MKEAQEVYDAVVGPMLKQNQQSFDPVEDVCKYYGPGGLRCAVGFLIPEDVYDARWDEINAETIKVVTVIGLEQHYNLLLDLQKVHDDNNDTSTWPALLTAVAERHGLSAEVIA